MSRAFSSRLETIARIPSRPVLIALFVFAGMFYVSLWPWKFIGYKTDDARYVVSAQSLLQGRYVALYLAGTPPVNVPPPGFPALLMPFVLLFKSHIGWIKLVPTLLSLFSGILLWEVFDEWSEPERLMLVGAYLSNPLVVSFSSDVMSESFLLFLSLAIFWGLKTAFSTDSRWLPWGVGALLAWASLVRMESIVLVPAVFVAILLDRRWKWILPMTLAPCVPPALVAWRNFKVVGSPLYLPNVASSTGHVLKQGLGILYFANHGLKFMTSLFVDGLIAVPLKTNALAAWRWELPWAAVGGFMVMVGFLNRVDRKRAATLWLTALGSYIFLYGLVHSVWMVTEFRYFLPVIPFFLAFFYDGAKRILWPERWGKIGCGALAALVVCFYAAADLHIFYWATHPASRKGGAPETYAWMRMHVAPGEIVSAPTPEVTYLYTGLRGVRFFSAIQNRDEFRYWLLKDAVHYIFFKSGFSVISVQHMDPSADYALDLKRYCFWISSWPAVFRPVYLNVQEETAVLRVGDNIHFMKAYESYEQAISEMNRDQWDFARRDIRRALEESSELSTAWRALALVQLHAGDVNASKKSLQTALRLEPTSPWSWFYLAKIYQQRRETESANQAYQKVEALIAETGEAPELLSEVQQERAKGGLL